MKNEFSTRVCAGIILYNPETELLEKNIKAIEEQVDCIYLFDNGSKNTEQISEMLKAHNNVHYEYSGENNGIAYGLNRVLDFAEKNEYEWFLSMDQDSVCADNMIEVYSKFADNPEIALITPFILNNGKYTIESYKALGLPAYEEIEPVKGITSACLSRGSAVRKAGGFDDRLFIDFVDIDMNCRVALAGYKIVRANETYLLQKMGEAKSVPVFEFLYKLTKLDFFRKARVASVYSDMRLYYYARNSYYVHKKYSNAGFRSTPLNIFMIFCYYTIAYPISRSRIKMWKSILKGFCDGRRFVKNEK